MTAAPRNQKLTVVVAALTRDRPQMLRALLNSLARVECPQNVTATYLIVENADKEASRSVVEATAAESGLPIRYVLEPKLGIPCARNRAAHEAIAMGADLLVFVDDDEEVAADWLLRLVDGYRKSSAVLLGAPLRMRPLPAETLSWSQRLMQRSLAARYKRKEDRAARLATLEDTPRVTIVTNNWLAETRLFSEHGVWFDEEMRFTGGTDAKFYAEVRKRGLTTGWVADAYVYETIPKERLTFGYQFRRGRDQSNTNFRRRRASGSTSAVKSLASVAIRCVFLLVMVLTFPFVGGRTYADVARNAGWITGRITALLGRRSKLYAQVTGS